MKGFMQTKNFFDNVAMTLQTDPPLGGGLIPPLPSQPHAEQNTF